MAVASSFVDAVGAAQGHFRRLLEAMAEPGRVVTLGAEIARPPPPLAPATFALALSLVDLETPLWLDQALRCPDVLETLRFHCGAPIVEATQRAAFALAADASGLPPLDAFAPGTAEYPDRSTTLIVQVGALGQGRSVRLSGPGIEGVRGLMADGPAPGFWQQVRANHARFPEGIDIVLVEGVRIAALPRSTAVEIL
jgi:alpha-D-ribose 1-methylphosphonate 5-triphosphate synthase subunit PhnH